MKARYGQEEKIDVLPGMTYISFGDVYDKAQMEMLNIMSKPYWFEKAKEEDGNEEPGGRD